MPIKTQSDLPAKEILESENIFVMDENRALHQDIRPIQILILNLMPVKQDTEIQLLRALSNSPLQVDITFLHMSTHISKNTSASHLNKFYQVFDEIKDNKYDGLIITGAPVEQLAYEEVNYWDELTKVMDWAQQNVTSVLHLCWGAQAGLYHYYGIKKYQLDKKMFGIYEHKVANRKIPLVRGFDDYFFAPHSRHTEVRKEDVEKIDNLIILAESKDAGLYLIMEKTGKNIFVMGHPEYDRLTLKNEYFRDKNKGLDIQLPVNYFPDDDDTKRPKLQWRSHANNLYTNWLDYYVYQITPYEL